MGSLTVTTPYKRAGAGVVRSQTDGDLRLLPFTFTLSTSYATGGDTIAAASMPSGYKDLVSPWAIGVPNGMGAKLDVANSKLLIFAASVTGGAEATATTNLQTAMGSTAITVYFLVR